MNRREEKLAFLFLVHLKRYNLVHPLCEGKGVEQCQWGGGEADQQKPHS